MQLVAGQRDFGAIAVASVAFFCDEVRDKAAIRYLISPIPVWLHYSAGEINLENSPAGQNLCLYQVSKQISKATWWTNSSYRIASESRHHDRDRRGRGTRSSSSCDGGQQKNDDLSVIWRRMYLITVISNSNFTMIVGVTLATMANIVCSGFGDFAPLAVTGMVRRAVRRTSLGK